HEGQGETDLARRWPARQPDLEAEREGPSASRDRYRVLRRHGVGHHPGDRHSLTAPRAAVVVTGSELVHGVLADANAPFLARELLRLGLELQRIVVVGDRPEQLQAALREGVEADLCVVSGGLGPTHDDRTVEAVARVLSSDVAVDA